MPSRDALTATRECWLVWTVGLVGLLWRIAEVILAAMVLFFAPIDETTRHKRFATT